MVGSGMENKQMEKEFEVEVLSMGIFENKASMTESEWFCK